jgi:hypothetical protein
MKINLFIVIVCNNAAEEDSQHATGSCVEKSLLITTECSTVNFTLHSLTFLARPWEQHKAFKKNLPNVLRLKETRTVSNSSSEYPSHIMPLCACRCHGHAHATCFIIVSLSLTWDNLNVNQMHTDFFFRFLVCTAIIKSAVRPLVKQT